MSLARTVSRLGSLALLCAMPVRAAAHISLDQGGTHLSRYGDAELKAVPCGRPGGARGAHVYGYEPGQTITVSIIEVIAHPSYFRIAFQADGDDAFREPASIDPIDPTRACPDGPDDHCGPSDYFNTPNVLMDDLDPHLAGAAGPKYTWSVKLPDVECDACTLQIIQVMEDDTLHGPYDPTPGVGVEDVYHQCIDLLLRHGVKQGLQTGAAAPRGGCASSGARADWGWVALALLGAVALRCTRLRARRAAPR